MSKYCAHFPEDQRPDSLRTGEIKITELRIDSISNDPIHGQG